LRGVAASTLLHPPPDNAGRWNGSVTQGLVTIGEERKSDFDHVRATLALRHVCAQ
jgi:hypothetical protein